jgi:hypothetical protein
MSKPISRQLSVYPQRLACLLLCLGAIACGSTTGDLRAGAGAGDSPGGSAGQSTGGTSGAGGSKPTGAGAGGESAASGGRAGASGSGSGGSGADASAGMGGKGSGVDLGYCPGQMPRDGYAACATDADCTGSTSLCRDQPYSGAGLCGACFQPTPPCTDDAGCSPGVCAPYTHPCACSSGLKACVSACTATSCPSDQQCASGHCVPRSCMSDWTCEAGYRCAAAGAATKDSHGCEPIPCTDGYTCPSGTTCDAASASKDQRGCVVIHCSQPGGYVCPTNDDCVVGSPGSGCVLRKCKASSDCACGTCRNGSCADQPGICLSPPPP